MAKVKILIEGYAKIFDDYEQVSPSVVLVQTDEFNMIIDPGFNRQALLGALESAGLATRQIDYVFLTHNHMDHFPLTGMFENAIVLDNEDQYINTGIIKRQTNGMFGPDIEIISTPGHDQFHGSLIVKTDDMGTVVVAGDVFWWVDGEEPAKTRQKLIALQDPYVKNQEQLTANRNQILDIADYIVPGHGKMFKNGAK